MFTNIKCVNKSIKHFQIKLNVNGWIQYLHFTQPSIVILLLLKLESCLMALYVCIIVLYIVQSQNYSFKNKLSKTPKFSLETVKKGTVLHGLFRYSIPFNGFTTEMFLTNSVKNSQKLRPSLC